MKLYEYTDSNWQVEFIYSPYFEMLCSLHVIAKHDHHLSRLNWYRDIVERIDTELYDEIKYFGGNYYEWLSAMDFKKFLHGVNDLNVIAALDCIAEIDIIDFIYTILRGSLSKIDIERYVEKGSYKGEFTKSLLSGRLLDPEEIANTILYLSSKKASAITGSVVPVDLGESSK